MGRGGGGLVLEGVGEEKKQCLFFNPFKTGNLGLIVEN